MKFSHSILNSQFRIFVGLSFLVHVLFLFFLIFIPSAQFFSKKIEIKQAIRVDMVGLPDIQKKISIQKKEIKKEKKKSVSLSKKKLKKTVKKKKEIKKKEAIKKKAIKSQPSLQKEIETKQAQALEKLKEPSYKGEKLSKGESAEGEVDSLLMYGYFSRVRAHIKMRWSLPRILADKGLRATVLIEVNSRGEVIKIALDKTSGNEAFDQIVVETIKMASPLPEPPLELIPLLDQGVGFNFPD